MEIEFCCLVLNYVCDEQEFFLLINVIKICFFVPKKNYGSLVLCLF